MTTYSIEQLKMMATTAAAKAGIDVPTFLGLIESESNWQVNATNPSGAFGLAQLMPATAAQYGVTPGDFPSDVQANLDAGAQTYKYFEGLYGGDTTKAIAGYKGWGSQLKNGGKLSATALSQVNTALDHIAKYSGIGTATDEPIKKKSPLGSWVNWGRFSAIITLS